MVKKLMWLFIFIILVSPTLAQPPLREIQTSTSDEGYQIKDPEIGLIKQGAMQKFHLHVFNKSDGYPIVEGISCDFHLYNQTGSHIFRDIKTTVENDYDYEFEVTVDNFTSVGDYTYIAQCNNSRLGGFISVPIAVTSHGSEIIDAEIFSSTPVAFVLAYFLAALVCLVVGWFFYSAGDKWYNIMFLAIFSMFAIGFASIGIGSLNQFFTNTIDSGVSLIGRMQFVFFVIVFILTMMGIIYNVLQRKKRKENPLE